MPASQSGVFSLQQFTNAGAPLVGGRLYTYVFGTTTLKTAYTDAAASIPHTYTADGLGGQYLALDARGIASRALGAEATWAGLRALHELHRADPFAASGPSGRA